MRRNVGARRESRLLNRCCLEGRAAACEYVASFVDGIGGKSVLAEICGELGGNWVPQYGRCLCCG